MNYRKQDWLIEHSGSQRASRKPRDVSADIGFRTGDVVELEHTTDLHTELEPGARGTVAVVDGAGTVHVTWDDGHTLGMVLHAGDRIRLVYRPTSHS